ncbi:MAG: glycosyltransferase, partial [Polyangiales bacterium]
MSPRDDDDRATRATTQSTRRLTICAVSPVFCHPSWQGSGMARTATGLLVALARRGHRVTVVSPLHDLDRAFAPPRDTSFHDGNLRLLYSATARPTRFGTSHRGLEALLTPLLHESDLAYFHGFLSPWIDRAASLARSANVPYVIQDHGKLTPSIFAHRAIAKRVYLRVRGRSILQRAARVLASTEALARALTAWDPTVHWGWCSNGLDAEEFDRAAPARPIDAPYVLSLAYLDPRKNPALLVRAFARVAAQH